MSRKPVAILTLVAFFGATLVPSAQAGIISTDSYIQKTQADAQRADVAHMLQREDVREQMLALGVDPANVEARLAGLSDAEVAQLADRMQELPAGAGILEVLLVVVLVFVILDIAGVTDVFPFIDSAE